MSLLSSILPSTSGSEPDSFDWGMAEFSDVLHNGVLYEKAVIDFLNGELRLYRFHDPKRLLEQQVPTARKKLLLTVQHISSALEPSSDETKVADLETYLPSELLSLEETSDE